MEEAGQRPPGRAGESWPIDSIEFGKIPLFATGLRWPRDGLKYQFERNFHDVLERLAICSSVVVIRGALVAALGHRLCFSQPTNGMRGVANVRD
jgi:hypothetical protein